MATKHLSAKGISANNVSNASSKAAWVRDPNWLVLPSIIGQQMFTGLMAVFTDSNYVSLLATTNTGNYQVDWGDGTIEQFASNIQAYHQYDYNTFDVSNTTLITHNGASYKQAIVKVTAVSGNLTGVNLNKLHNATGLTSGCDVNWLDIAIEGANITSFVLSAASLVVASRLLESCYVGTLNAAFSDWSYMFYACVSIKTVGLRNTTAVTNMSYMFSTCYSLTSVPLFNTAAVTNTASMFQNCYSLTSVPLFNTAAVTNTASMFQNCYSLTTIERWNHLS